MKRISFLFSIVFTLLTFASTALAQDFAPTQSFVAEAAGRPLPGLDSRQLALAKIYDTTSGTMKCNGGATVFAPERKSAHAFKTCDLDAAYTLVQSLLPNTSTRQRVAGWRVALTTSNARFASFIQLDTGMLVSTSADLLVVLDRLAGVYYNDADQEAALVRFLQYLEDRSNPAPFALTAEELQTTFGQMQNQLRDMPRRETDRSIQNN